MADDEKSPKKSAWDSIQAALTILTPLLVIGFGAWLNSDINKIQSEISQVKAMREFMEMMAGHDDRAKSKMAAYALYMLNQNDPEMAASVILAPGREDLVEVLEDLAKREPRIDALLQQIEAQTSDYEEENTAAQNAARQIRASVVSAPLETRTGWCYLGTWRDAWSDQSLEGVEMAGTGQRRVLARDVRLREGYPSPENRYRMQEAVGVVRKGQEVEILGMKSVGDRIWAEVAILD